jgi:hypothetical protein
MVCRAAAQPSGCQRDALVVKVMPMASPTRQIAVRLPHDLLQALEKRAEEERRPLAALIRLILEDEVRGRIPTRRGKALKRDNA